MTKFIVVRHGETNYNRQEIIQGWQQSELSSNGLEQAKSVAKDLPGTPDVIISSDLLRCRQTTEIISLDLPGVPIFYDWRFRERSFGNLENQPSSSVDWDIFFAHEDIIPENNVEPEQHLNERLKLGIRSTEMIGADTILLVTHGGIFNRFGALLSDDYQPRRYKNTDILVFDINYSDPIFTPADYPKWSFADA